MAKPEQCGSMNYQQKVSDRNDGLQHDSTSPKRERVVRPHVLQNRRFLSAKDFAVAQLNHSLARRACIANEDGETRTMWLDELPTEDF